MKLVLIRGLPGSGKSTIARSMAGYVHLEADMFFAQDGEYKFDAGKIKDAHAWCQAMTRDALSQEKDVVVSNTFTQQWEMIPYIRMATEYGIVAQIIEAKGNFMNVHGVPPEVIEKMRARWEDL